MIRPILLIVVTGIVLSRSGFGFVSRTPKFSTHPRTHRAAIAPNMKFATGSITTPEVPQETKPQWYILNCATGNEMTCKKLLEIKISKLNLWSEVLEIVVPTQAMSSTRGKKVYANHRTLYPSYVFLYMIMGPDVHNALINTDHVINFVGRDHGVYNNGGSGMTGARGFVSPIPLTEREIDGFQLRTAEGAKLDDPTLGFTIGEFVEVTEGPNAGERGAVRLVRNGMVVVRLYAYGQRMDLEFAPEIVKKVSVDTVEMEVRPEMLPKAPMTFEEQEKAAARAEAKAGRWRERQERMEERRHIRQDDRRANERYSRSDSATVTSSLSSSSSSSTSSAYLQWRKKKSSPSSTTQSTEDLEAGDGDNFLDQLSMLLDDTTDESVSSDKKTERERERLQQEDDFLSSLMDDLNAEPRENVAEGFSSTFAGGESEPRGQKQAPAVGGGVGGDRGGLGPKQLKDMTVAELKDACRELGLKVGGTKAVLQERLRVEASMQ